MTLRLFYIGNTEHPPLYETGVWRALRARLTSDVLDVPVELNETENVALEHVGNITTYRALIVFGVVGKCCHNDGALYVWHRGTEPSERVDDSPIARDQYHFGDVWPVLATDDCFFDDQVVFLSEARRRLQEKTCPLDFPLQSSAVSIGVKRTQWAFCESGTLPCRTEECSECSEQYLIDAEQPSHEEQGFTIDKDDFLSFKHVPLPETELVRVVGTRFCF